MLISPEIDKRRLEVSFQDTGDFSWQNHPKPHCPGSLRTQASAWPQSGPPLKRGRLRVCAMIVHLPEKKPMLQLGGPPANPSVQIRSKRRSPSSSYHHVLHHRPIRARLWSQATGSARRLRSMSRLARKPPSKAPACLQHFYTPCRVPYAAAACRLRIRATVIWCYGARPSAIPILECATGSTWPACQETGQLRPSSRTVN